MAGSDIPKGAAVIGAVKSFCSDDCADLSRPAALPLVFLADMDRDPLEGVTFLFQLALSSAASPFFKRTVGVANTGPLTFFCPFFHL